ncbi:MAG: 3-dehydroquinate synthase [Crocinitomicaceae bacterium]|nr:3-dehydroquinate synthase [Crocinitomicaceae bacterium]
MSSSIDFRNTKLLFGNLAESGFEKILTRKYPDSRFVILTDENVNSHWSEFLVTNFDFLNRSEIIEIPAGEENKNLEICHSVWQTLSEMQFSRKDVLINFGGGVVTDLGGFVASTFKRGIPFVNIPTTLLAQVDASVGGKTGIDLDAFKNQIGTFAEPEFVFISEEFLETLPDEQLISGYAEMLKHGLIADAGYWNKLSQIDPLSEAELMSQIKKSVQIKSEIVLGDFDEKGPRKILNFGHTIGHALESYFLEKKNPQLHGHMIGMGMIAEAFLAREMKLISDSEFEQIESVCRKYFGKYLKEKPDAEMLIQFMQNDKKNESGKINFSLLSGIGKCKFNVEVSDELIRKSIECL